MCGPAADPGGLRLQLRLSSQVHTERMWGFLYMTIKDPEAKPETTILFFS